MRVTNRSWSADDEEVDILDTLREWLSPNELTIFSVFRNSLDSLVALANKSGDITMYNPQINLREVQIHTHGTNGSIVLHTPETGVISAAS